MMVPGDISDYCWYMILSSIGTTLGQFTLHQQMQTNAYSRQSKVQYITSQMFFWSI